MATTPSTSRSSTAPRMPLWLRSTLRIGLIVLIALGGALWLLSRFLQRAPDFYVVARAQVGPEQQQQSDQFMRQTTTLVNEARRDGPWSALFTAEQINGYLAVDVAKNHAEELPEGVSDPRVQIEPDGVTIACRWSSSFASAVFSLKADVYVERPNVIVVRLRQARAGALPLPISGILDEAVRSAEAQGAKVTRSTIDGDPQFTVELPAIQGDGNSRVSIETIELRQDAVFVSGKTLPADFGK